MCANRSLQKDCPLRECLNLRLYKISVFVITGADPAVQVRITALYQYIGLKLNAGKERFLPGMSAVRNFFLTVIVFTEEAGMI